MKFTVNITKENTLRFLGYIIRRMILCVCLVGIILMIYQPLTDNPIQIEDIRTLLLMYFSALWGILMGDWT